MPRWGPDNVENSGGPTNQIGTIAPDAVACPGKLDRRLVPIFAGVVWFITTLSWPLTGPEIYVVPIDWETVSVSRAAAAPSQSAQGAGGPEIPLYIR